MYVCGVGRTSSLTQPFLGFEARGDCAESKRKGPSLMLWISLWCMYFCLQGARVIVGDLQVSDGEKVAREIGDNATFVPMDVSKSQN